MSNQCTPNAELGGPQIGAELLNKTGKCVITFRSTLTFGSAANIERYTRSSELDHSALGHIVRPVHDYLSYLGSEFRLTSRASRGGCVFSYPRPPPVAGRSRPGDRPMIPFNIESQINASDWQTAFVEMLPEIKRWLR